MKSIQAWGFLVSRNQYLDYRTVVAPNFMCQSGTSSLLAKAAGGDLTQKGAALYRKISHPKLGNLTLVFRVIEAIAKDTGIAGNGVLKDSFGREIRLIEGILLKEIMPDILVTEDIIVTEGNLEEIHKQLVKYYREFWDYSNPNPAIPSEPFTLPENSSDDCLNYQILNPYPVGANQIQIKPQLSLATSNSQTLESDNKSCTLDSQPNLLQKLWDELWIYLDR
ncbi:hypothetical protein ANSO36C_17460 [Nostoc cf. commune SO-36]|uniref:Uncharacterized protein n=1 Tax=Nostoc cf. commune SO-36 TaxID=449208 RepID=A0ABM7YZ69_NOSCO|nr:hypothetical protein [Nostoc commune]BDI15944.1 hypothetical protein ANSO36C_17460 [Nostoc cf. commune SO-36]